MIARLKTSPYKDWGDECAAVLRESRFYMVLLPVHAHTKKKNAASVGLQM